MSSKSNQKFRNLGQALIQGSIVVYTALIGGFLAQGWVTPEGHQTNEDNLRAAQTSHQQMLMLAKSTELKPASLAAATPAAQFAYHECITAIYARDREPMVANLQMCMTSLASRFDKLTLQGYKKKSEETKSLQRTAFMVGSAAGGFGAALGSVAFITMKRRKLAVAANLTRS